MTMIIELILLLISTIMICLTKNYLINLFIWITTSNDIRYLFYEKSLCSKEKKEC